MKLVFLVVAQNSVPSIGFSTNFGERSPAFLAHCSHQYDDCEPFPRFLIGPLPSYTCRRGLSGQTRRWHLSHGATRMPPSNQRNVTPPAMMPSRDDICIKLVHDFGNAVLSVKVNTIDLDLSELVYNDSLERRIDIDFFRNIRNTCQNISEVDPATL